MKLRRIEIVFIGRSDTDIECAQMATFNENFEVEKGNCVTGYDITPELRSFAICRNIEDRYSDDSKWEEFKEAIKNTPIGQADMENIKTIHDEVFNALKKFFEKK
jgi:hypothetical protein